MRIALAGAGAFGEKHLDGLKLIDGVEVTSLVGRRLEPTQAIAAKYGIGHATTDLAKTLARDDVDAVILCTPTQMHARQAIQCMEAGKHVQVEIPLADSLADAVFGGDRLRRLEAAADEAGHLDAVDQLQSVEMLFPERAGTGEGDSHANGSRTMWPSAVLLAGT